MVDLIYIKFLRSDTTCTSKLVLVAVHKMYWYDGELNQYLEKLFIHKHN